MPSLRLPRRTRRPKRTSRRSKVPAATKSYVKRMLPKTELKRFVSYYDEITGSTLVEGSAVPLTNIGQGTASYMRIGNEICVKGLHIKGLFNNNAATPNYVRMMVLWSACDTNTSFGSAYYFAESNLAGTTGTISNVTGANMMYYPLNTKQFTPIYDKVFKLGGSGDPSCTRMFSKFVKLNKRIKYIANNYGDGLQDYQISVVYLYAESGDDTTSGQIVETSHVCRLWYSDA